MQVVTDTQTHGYRFCGPLQNLGLWTGLDCGLDSGLTAFLLICTLKENDLRNSIII